MSYVFISYSHKDKIRATQLEEFLTSNKIDCWLDRTISAGEDWRDEIDQALANSFAVAVILTLNSIASHEVTYEWSWALGRDIPVIPLLFEEIPDHKRHSRLLSN